MQHTFTILLIWSLLLPAACVSGAVDDPLVNLRKAHPRLMVLDDRIQTVKALVQSDRLAADTLAQLKRQADKMIDAPPAKHVLIGPRLLDQSRSALRTISTCAGVYRLTGDVRYAARARKEMLTVAAFADWNPSHFLDVAEMTNACGIGYDWIYDQLSTEERAEIRQAIVEKGLKQGLIQYQKHTFWTDCNMNWGQVCAGGLTVGALAIADEEPAITREILELTHGTMIKPMQEFAPDGGWEEGPSYWTYATSYNIFYLASVESALGTDYGLEKQPGFSDTGWFHIHLTGPTKKMFNFADAGDGLEPAPQMFWLAAKFNHPGYAAWERANSAGHFNIFHLLWFNPDGQWPPHEDALPLDANFKHVNVGAFRSDWVDSNAWYVAFKGGDNAVNHAHLDLGSFVLDALGQRWGTDLGPDNYNLPGYFGKQRFTYYRLSTRGHNTITFNGANQKLKSKAPIIWFLSEPARASAVIDLSAGYPMVQSVRRGICMLDRRQVLIQDEIQSDQPLPFEWNFHTAAKVEVDGKTAVLAQGGVQIRVTLLRPTDGKFEITNCDVPAEEKPNTGITDLMVHASGKNTVAVVFSEIGDLNRPAVRSLADWVK